MFVGVLISPPPPRQNPGYATGPLSRVFGHIIEQRVDLYCRNFYEEENDATHLV